MLDAKRGGPPASPRRGTRGVSRGSWRARSRRVAPAIPGARRGGADPRRNCASHGAGVSGDVNWDVEQRLRRSAVLRSAEQGALLEIQTAPVKAGGALTARARAAGRELPSPRRSARIALRGVRLQAALARPGRARARRRRCPADRRQERRHGSTGPGQLVRRPGGSAHQRERQAQDERAQPLQPAPAGCAPRSPRALCAEEPPTGEIGWLRLRTGRQVDARCDQVAPAGAGWPVL